MRTERPHSFFPIFVYEDGSSIHSVGEPYYGTNYKEDVVPPAGTRVIWPLFPDGKEGRWQVSKENILEMKSKGFIKMGGFTKTGMAISYISEGEQRKVNNGDYKIVGHRADGSIITDSSDYTPTYIPGTSWQISTHDATEHGTKLLSKFIGKRFEFPKSLYAVHDVIRFFTSNKPNALILDFFAGSGTTLHAVNLLNAEDGGQRRCVMVTNNEIGEPKEKELRPQGLRPGDEEWERWGIARYVNWPRTRCSILGTDVNGHPIEGEYITTKKETKLTDRRFTQISFLQANATLKQKKALVTLINKQKGVKLPTMTEDAPWLASEDDSCNAAILFDVAETDSWLEALEGNDHITNFYVVAEKDAAYKQVRTEVQELMGLIEESVPVRMPMSDGFRANAAYFKLGFLDKRSVERGKQLEELLSILWMKAGAKGECPAACEGEYSVWPDNNMALLKDESYFPLFQKELAKHPKVKMVYLVTDSQSAYLGMTANLKGRKTYQLYRDYLENFRINYAVK